MIDYRLQCLAKILPECCLNARVRWHSQRSQWLKQNQFPSWGSANRESLDPQSVILIRIISNILCTLVNDKIQEKCNLFHFNKHLGQSPVGDKNGLNTSCKLNHICIWSLSDAAEKEKKLLLTFSMPPGKLFCWSPSTSHM